MKNNSFEVTLRINIFVLLKPTKEVDIDQGKELYHQILHLYMEQTSFKLPFAFILPFLLKSTKDVGVDQERCSRTKFPMVIYP